MNKIFDTHSHYDDEQFNEDCYELLTKMHNDNVDLILTCGCDVESSKKAMELSEKFDYVYFSAGFHPENEINSTPEDLNRIEKMLEHKKCVAVGEIGLEYHWLDCCPKELQIQRFEEQVLMAVNHDLPVIVHDREAHQDTFDILKKYKPKGVVHCYSGSVEMMKEIVKLGMYIGLNGVVTFKNARKSVEVATQVPIDRLLLETDAPYIAPVPFRGKRCNSSMIKQTAMVIAQNRGMSQEEIINITNENGKRLFNIV